jgi:hypothetical protein
MRTPAEDRNGVDGGGLGLLDIAVVAEHLAVDRWSLAGAGHHVPDDPTFTARTIFLPPQQQGIGAVSALASLGTGRLVGGIKSADSTWR